MNPISLNLTSPKLISRLVSRPSARRHGSADRTTLICVWHKHRARSGFFVTAQKTKFMHRATVLNTNGEDIMADQDGAENNSGHPTAQNDKVLTPQLILRTPEKKPFGGHWPKSLPAASRPDPAQSVKTELAQMTEAWRKYQSTRARDGVYILLDQAYKIGLRWKENHCAKKNSRLMLKLQDDPICMKPEPFAVLLYCAGVVDAKDRSKFSRVLRVAEAHEATSVKAFAKRHGGINRVAAMFF
jgi:hypothetical protein